jgi:sulfur-oxidizing protein SoxZ
VQARDIIRKFTCRYDGEVVFNATLSPAIAANPFIAFTTIATQSGPISFTWEGDNGFAQTETRHINVT